MRLRPHLLPHLLLVFACLPAGVYAEVRDTGLQYRYYDVSVRPGPPLGRQVREVSPVRDADGVHIGHTDWHVDWHFRWHYDAAGWCRFTDVDVELRGGMRLPRLVNATPAQNAGFERFMEALRRHEMGHYEHGRQAAREIERNLLTMPPVHGCDALEAEGNRRAKAIIARFAEMDVSYDRETRHGATQGASLP